MPAADGLVNHRFRVCAPELDQVHAEHSLQRLFDGLLGVKTDDPIPDGRVGRQQLCRELVLTGCGEQHSGNRLGRFSHEPRVPL